MPYWFAKTEEEPPVAWEWYVYIVAKGDPVVRPRSHELFNAGTLTDEKILWNLEHLLEIHYDIAEINQFTNIWGLIRDSKWA
jgi:hypothetical protein